MDGRVSGERDKKGRKGCCTAKGDDRTQSLPRQGSVAGAGVGSYVVHLAGEARGKQTRAARLNVPLGHSYCTEGGTFGGRGSIGGAGHVFGR